MQVSQVNFLTFFDTTSFKYLIKLVFLFWNNMQVSQVNLLTFLTQQVLSI